MSIDWMSRVFASPVPCQPTERLMLLALADNANDEGVCWPSMRYLAAKCALRTKRGARKVVARLETDGFVAREVVPGKATRYHLCVARLEARARNGSAPDRLDRGTASPPGAVWRDRTGRTEGTGHKPPENRLQKQQQHGAPVARAGRVVQMSAVIDRAAATLSKTSAVQTALVTRGVDPSVAARLAAQSDPAVIQGLVARFDREGGHTPGWLVKAIREGWSAGREATCGGMLSYQEALRAFDRLGGRFDQHFEPVRRSDGQTLFRQRRPA